ncbi:MAG: addiction module protein [Fimbriiglobus sp.]
MPPATATAPATDSGLTPALIEQALKLSPADQGRLVALLQEADADDPDVVKTAWKAELARRVESVRDGTAVLYTPTEVDEHFRRVRAEVAGQ